MSNTYTILITGSRDYRDTKIIRAAIINAIKGTWDMIERAKKHGIQDIRIY